MGNGGEDVYLPCLDGIKEVREGENQEFLMEFFFVSR